MLGCAVAVGCTSEPAPPPPDVLLVTLDTTRADALGAYGRVPSPTPALDALAASGVRFDEALSTVPLTLPAHASVLTGRYPDRTGVRANDGFFLAEEAVTLAERLSDAGYRTGAFVSAAVLDAVFGLDQGFGVYADQVSGVSEIGAVPSVPAEVVAERAHAWIAAEAGRPGPLLLWVHFYDAHLPHEPDAALLAQAGDAYHAEVARVDRAVGGLLHHLRVTGRDPLVVVVGDHGEGRGDHGEQTHGLFVYRSTMRVPLIVAGPGVTPGVVETPVSQVDLTPTLLALAGLDPGEVDGRSLAPALRGAALAPAPVYGESWYPRLGFGLGQLTFRQDDQGRVIEAPRPERYAWRDDPGEERDLGATEADLVALTAWRGRGDATPPRTAALDAEVQARLAALGYVGSALPVDDVELSALPDAKDHRDLPRLLALLRHAVATQPPEAGAAAARAFVVQFPGVPAARLLEVGAREAAGDPAGALAALQPLLDAAPEDPSLRTLRGHLLARWPGHETEGRAALDAVLSDRPDWTPARVAVATLDWDGGELDAALSQADAGLARRADSVPLRALRGALLGDLHRDAEAVGVLRAVLEDAPDQRQVRYFLARSLARLGQAGVAVPLAREALLENPGDPSVEALLGAALFVTGDADAAEPHLSAAAADPETAQQPLLLLADLASQRGDAPTAWARWEAARALGDDPMVATVQASLLMREGRVEEARAVVEGIPAAQPR